MKIREYTIVKNELNHPMLEELRCCEWKGDLTRCDEIHRMLNDIFKMNRLSTEMSYVVAFDHAKKIKGVMQVGHGSPSETPMPMQNIFTFLMLAGAYAFVISHNHVSNMSEASSEDKTATFRASMLANMFDMEFIGHMIINPRGYILDGGISLNSEDSDDIEDSNNTQGEIEILENGMAATYVFGQRIEGELETIKKIIG